jgi:hypothetical protein
MKRSFMNYVQESNTKIGGFPDTTVVETIKKKPKISVAPKATEVTPTQITEDIRQPEPEIQSNIVIDELTNPFTEIIEPITEDQQSSNQMLIETFMQMKDFLVEQQNTQNTMNKMMMELVETVKTQNLFIQQKFDQLDESAIFTAKTLKETSDKLEALVIREISMPTPIVNVSLSEQKKIIKTVNRDANGLISQITEEIQQSVSEDK